MATLSMRTCRPNQTLVLILAAHLLVSGVVATGKTEHRFAQEGEKCNGNLSPERAVLCEGDMECRTETGLLGAWGACTRPAQQIEPARVKRGEKCMASLSPKRAVLCEGDLHCKTELIGGWGVCAPFESDAAPAPAKKGEKCNRSLHPSSARVCEEGLACRTRLLGGWGVCTLVESDVVPVPMKHHVPDVIRRHRCDVAWCSHFTKYALPYSVEIGTSDLRWIAPFADGTSKEQGTAVLLSEPHLSLRVNTTDAWEAGYFSSNRYTPDPMNSTLCTCEYMSRDVPGSPIFLSDYLIAQVPNSAHRPFAEVCAPFLRNCPADNRTAFELIGAPFTEMYTNCMPMTEEVVIATSGGSDLVEAAPSPLWAYVSNALAITGFSLFALVLAFGSRGVMAQDDDQDGYLSIE